MSSSEVAIVAGNLNSRKAGFLLCGFDEAIDPVLAVHNPKRADLLRLKRHLVAQAVETQLLIRSEEDGGGQVRVALREPIDQVAREPVASGGIEYPLVTALPRLKPLNIVEPREHEVGWGNVGEVQGQVPLLNLYRWPCYGRHV